MPEHSLRPLTVRERSLLERILSVPFPGAAELREQLTPARAESPPDAPGFDIVVPDTARRSPMPGRLVPVDAYVLDENAAYVGELLLWVSEGRLSWLEYAWVTDEPPTELPDPRDVRVAPAAGP